MAFAACRDRRVQRGKSRHVSYVAAGAPGATAHALPAPQAGLISALAQAVIQNDPEKWHLMGWGALIGVLIIAFDWLLSKTTRSLRMPPR